MKKIILIIAASVLGLVMMLPSGLSAQSSGLSNKATLGNMPLLTISDNFSASGTSSLAGQLLSNDNNPSVDPEANKWALVIGIANYDAYQGIDGDVFHTDEDAKEMTKALVENYGFPKDHIITLLNKEATYSTILSAIAWLDAMEDKNSTVVFFYSGHGFSVPDAGIEGLTGPVDDDKEVDGYDEGIVSHDLYPISDGLLGEMFSTFESQKLALIFGPCNSGGMFDRDNTKFDNLERDGRVICAASKADQLAWDYQNLGNTLFGYYFIDQGIIRGEADVNGDGVVSLEEALDYAYIHVTAEQPDSQPQIYDGFDGEFIP